MSAELNVRYPLNEWQHHAGWRRAIEEAAAYFPDGWRFTVIRDERSGRTPRGSGGFRLGVDGPGVTTSRFFESASAPTEITEYLRRLRQQLVR
jgi:hypothetical protein